MSGASPGALALCDPRDRQPWSRPTRAGAERGGDQSSPGTRRSAPACAAAPALPEPASSLLQRLPLDSALRPRCLVSGPLPADSLLCCPQQTPLVSALQAVGSRVSHHLGKSPAGCPRSLPHLPASEGPFPGILLLLAPPQSSTLPSRTACSTRVLGSRQARWCPAHLCLGRLGQEVAGIYAGISGPLTRTGAAGPGEGLGAQDSESRGCSHC